MASSVITSNWLGLKLHTPAKLLVGLCDASETIPVARAPNMSGDIEAFLIRRFSTGDTSAAQAWQAVRSATTSTGVVPTGVTYIAKTTRGSTARNYVGKTWQTMAARYPGAGLPAGGGMADAFAEYEAGETVKGGGATMDVTLYWTTNPSAVEGWCFAIAKAQKITLQNIQDPG